MMFTTKELYINSKRLSLYVYKNKNKTKIQQTNASKPTMYPDSHTLNSYTIFQFRAAMTGGRGSFVFLVVFFIFYYYYSFSLVVN